jgi:hypothetical protein
MENRPDIKNVARPAEPPAVPALALTLRSNQA